jgi:hypothetical protein
VCQLRGSGHNLVIPGSYSSGSVGRAAGVRMNGQSGDKWWSGFGQLSTNVDDRVDIPGEVMTAMVTALASIRDAMLLEQSVQTRTREFRDTAGGSNVALGDSHEVLKISTVHGRAVVMHGGKRIG